MIDHVIAFQGSGTPTPKRRMRCFASALSVSCRQVPGVREFSLWPETSETDREDSTICMRITFRHPGKPSMPARGAPPHKEVVAYNRKVTEEHICFDFESVAIRLREREAAERMIQLAKLPTRKYSVMSTIRCRCLPAGLFGVDLREPDDALGGDDGGGRRELTGWSPARGSAAAPSGRAGGRPSSRSDGCGCPSGFHRADRAEHQPHQLVAGDELQQHTPDHHQQPAGASTADPGICTHDDHRSTQATDVRSPAGQQDQCCERDPEHGQRRTLVFAGSLCASTQHDPPDAGGHGDRQQREVAEMPQPGQRRARRPPPPGATTWRHHMARVSRRTRVGEAHRDEHDRH